MTFQERSYSGRLFRPRPEVFATGEALFAVATPWGPRSSAQKALQSMQDFFLSAREDSEVTSPFEKLTCLSSVGNNLRVSLLLTNDAIYQEENRNEYKAGIELFTLAREGREIVWAQIGQPHVFLDREGLSLVALGSPADFAVDLSRGRRLEPPLPAQLLGLASTSNFAIQSFRPQPGDRLILLSRTLVPPAFHQLPRRDRSLERMTKVLAASDPESPFWLGILDL